MLLLFIVASIGYLLGSIKIKGIELGVSAILFVGLFFGSLDANLQIPNTIFQLGIILFVYSIGLSSGPAFFNSFKQNGLRDFLFMLGMLLLSGVICIGVAYLFGFDAATITGLYAGSTTNTPALAGVMDYVSNTYSAAEASGIKENLVIGYSISYPMGVLGGIIMIILMERVLKIDYEFEKQSLRKDYPIGDDFTSKAIRVTNPKLVGQSLRDLWNTYDWNVVFGRISSKQVIKLANWDTELALGDILMVVATKKELDKIGSILGEVSTANLTYDRSEFDTRRIFVSNHYLAGKTISSLNINEKFNCVITRIRRGDSEMLAKANTVLELGDRIRFVARRKDLKKLAKFFGDSYQKNSMVNLFSYGLGIGIGLLLGSIELPISETVSFKLGNAGGPLIVGLILGALRRTGPINWTLPYGANVTLRQIGLILLLATIGVSSGSAFLQSLSDNGLMLFLASVIISLLTALSVLFIGYKMVKIPFSILMGIVSNQPAILDFSIDRTKNQLPNFGYTKVFPIALISKIVIAQLLFLMLI